MTDLVTSRLALPPITLTIAEAVFAGKRATIEDLVRAKLPEAWPGRGLVERAFSASIEKIRADPARWLWGSRLMITRTDAEPLLVGSVVFHGCPPDGIAEVGYGVEEHWQRKGYATEATSACVAWALAQPGIVAVTATTPPWHQASIRVLEKSGLVNTGMIEHDTFGEVLSFTSRRP